MYNMYNKVDCNSDSIEIPIKVDWLIIEDVNEPFSVYDPYLWICV